MERLAEANWDYILFADGDRLLLDVVCGSVGIFEVAIELNSEERALWEAQGIAGLKPLIDHIRRAPGQFWHRKIELTS